MSSLLLDPNNFRFRQPGLVDPVPEGRFVEESVQSAILHRPKNDGLSEVKRSIAENGFVPVERIVIKEVEFVAGTSDVGLDASTPAAKTSALREKTAKT